jgi:hypothetical protein
MKKKVLLLVAAVVSIVLYFSTPYYNSWIFLRVLNPHLSVWQQMGRLDTNERRLLRYGRPYDNCMIINAIIHRAHAANQVVLLPPRAYLTTLGIPDFDVDPAVFYYFTGLRSVEANSAGVDSASLCLVPDNTHNITVKKIHNRKELDDLLNRYKPYLTQ